MNLVALKEDCHWHSSFRTKSRTTSGLRFRVRRVGVLSCFRRAAQVRHGALLRWNGQLIVPAPAAVLLELKLATCSCIAYCSAHVSTGIRTEAALPSWCFATLTVQGLLWVQHAPMHTYFFPVGFHGIAESSVRQVLLRPLVWQLELGQDLWLNWFRRLGASTDWWSQ